jgi:hypothetical protein
MAERAKKKRAAGAAGTPKASAKSSAAPTPAIPRRDLRRYIYAGIDVVFGVIYLVIVTKVALTQSTLDRVQLALLPVFAAGMAAGMLIAGPIGWRIAVGSCIALLASGLILIARILISISFLAGVYGGFGGAATFFAWVAVALVTELVLLLPLFQLKYVMSRGGRRTLGVLPPLPARAAS